MFEYYLMLIGFIFTTTTLAYLILYRKAVSEVSGRSGLTAIKEIRLDEEKLDKLKKALSGEKLDIESLLEELKEIRRQAEVVLDEERGGFEGEGGSDKGSS